MSYFSVNKSVIFFCYSEIKNEQIQSMKLENTEVKEEKTACQIPAFDNHVSTITTVIKSESWYVDAPRSSVSVVIKPGATVTNLEIKKEEEAERAVVRSSQQAKIPLKKRELKLAEDYSINHRNSNSSSIIVCNPSVIQNKDSLARERLVPDSLVPSGCQSASYQQQQQTFIASRQELSNGRTVSLVLPHKEEKNGLPGVVGHVGVICSPSGHQKGPNLGQQDQNGTCLDLRGPEAVVEHSEVRRQSVLVRKGPVEHEAKGAPPSHSDTEAQTTTKTPLKESHQPYQFFKGKEDTLSVSTLLQHTKEPKTHMVDGQLDKGTKTGLSSHQQKYDSLDKGEEMIENVSGLVVVDKGNKEDNEIKKGNTGKLEAVSGNIAPPVEVDLEDKNHCYQLSDGVNGGLGDPFRSTNSGPWSEERRGQTEEASSELQKEGIRLKIKIPPHRRNKLRGKGGKEEKERKQDLQEKDKQLRRSARICRYV